MTGIELMETMWKLYPDVSTKRLIEVVDCLIQAGHLKTDGHNVSLSDDPETAKIMYGIFHILQKEANEQSH